MSDAIPGVFSMKVIDGADKRPAMFVDQEQDRFFDTGKSEWLTDVPAVIRSLVMRESTTDDLFEMVQHDLVGDDDFAFMESKMQVPERVRTLHTLKSKLRELAAAKPALTEILANVPSEIRQTVVGEASEAPQESPAGEMEQPQLETITPGPVPNQPQEGADLLGTNVPADIRDQVLAESTEAFAAVMLALQANPENLAALKQVLGIA